LTQVQFEQSDAPSAKRQYPNFGRRDLIGRLEPTTRRSASSTPIVNIGRTHLSESTEPESLDERLRNLEIRLERMFTRERERREQEWRSAQRRWLTTGLVRVDASEEELQRAGIDTTVLETIFEFDRGRIEEFDDEKLWEIRGDGCGFAYGYCRGSSIEAVVKSTRYYLPVEAAEKVNAIRAQEFLKNGGTLGQAEQGEGSWRCDRGFVAAVRAEVKSRDAAGHAEEYRKLCERLDRISERLEAIPGRAQFEFMTVMMQAPAGFGLIYMRSKLAGVTAFLVAAAVGTIAADLRTGLAFGLAAWALVSLVWWKFRKNALKVMDQSVEDAGHAAGVPGNVVEDSLRLAKQQMRRSR
jgi:hypothetical protein